MDSEDEDRRCSFEGEQATECGENMPMYMRLKVKEEAIWERELGSAESGTITLTVCHVSLGLTQGGSGGQQLVKNWSQGYHHHHHHQSSTVMQWLTARGELKPTIVDTSVVASVMWKSEFV